MISKVVTYWLLVATCSHQLPIFVGGHLVVTIGLHLMLKVVTYWLAKLLDPQHNVVLSDEHQDFQVSHLSSLMT